MTDAPRLLTKREAADLLRISERTLDHWRAAGRIRAIVLGPGAVRFTRHEIERFIAEAIEGAAHE